MMGNDFFLFFDFQMLQVVVPRFLSFMARL